MSKKLSKTDLIREKIAKLLEEEGVSDSIVIFTLEGEEEPQVWRKGHWYDSAALMNIVLNQYRIKAVKELGL